MSTEGASPQSPGTSALIIIDMSVEQVAALTYQRAETIDTIRALLASCTAGVATPPFDLVVDSRLWIESARQTTLWSVHAEVGRANAPGAELIPELREPFRAIPETSRCFDPKLNYSSFASGTRLEASLREHEVTHVFLAGINTDYCVFATALDSFQRGFETRVIADAVSTVSGAAAHREALARTRAHFGPHAVVRAADVLERGAAAPTPESSGSGSRAKRAREAASD